MVHGASFDYNDLSNTKVPIPKEAEEAKNRLMFLDRVAL